MKKTLSKLFIAGVVVSMLAIASCSKEEAKPPVVVPGVTIPQSSRALVIDITGTWCPPCGAYGIPGFEAAIALRKSSILPIAIHSGDPLSNLSMDPIAALPRFKTGYVPRIVAGNGLIFDAGVYSDINATASKIAMAVDTFNSNHPIIAGIAFTNFKVSPADNNVTVDVDAKFFTAASGEYYIAVYFFENEVVSSQKISGGPDNANQKHNYVVRGASNGTWGEALTCNNDVNTRFTKSFTFLLNPSYNNAKLGVMALIWKKVGSDYVYINGNLKEQ